MAAFDFPPNAGHPAAPTVGEKWPVPPIAGKPVYTWDGEKWTTFGGTTGTIDAADEMPLPDATPGSIGSSLDYAREDHVHPTDPTIADKVSKGAGGDTMAGDLTIAKSNPQVALNKAADTENNIIVGYKAGSGRWAIAPGDNTAESGSNAGSNFAINHYSDAGASLGNAVTINRATGLMTVKAAPTADLGIATKLYVDTKTSYAPQRMSLAGGKSFDVAVPVGATAVRMMGFILPTSGTQFQPIISVSLAAGVFLTTAGDYQFSGFNHASNATPTAVSASHSAVTHQGIFLGTCTSATIGFNFDGYLSLTRPGTSNHFQGETRSGSWSTGGGTHYFYFHMVQTASSGSALSILALRFATNAGAGDVWGANSFVNLEWS